MEWSAGVKVRELIEKLELYANKYGDDIPVRTFDLDRDMCDIDEVEFNQNYDLEYYIYLGA
jgi:hypothetical protein